MKLFLIFIFTVIFSSLTFATISVSDSEVSIDFDYIYKDVYYAQQGDTSWTKTSCRGDMYDQYWHKDCVLDLSGASGSVFVAAYACNLINYDFDCNNNQWRVEEIQFSPSQTPTPTGKMIVPGNGWSGETPTPPSRGSSSAIGYDKEPIVRWDIVPYQTIDQDFEVGLLAFHVNGEGYNGEGINYVEFAVDGGNWVRVEEPTLNPRTQVKEWWVSLDVDAYSQDKQIEVRAKIYPTHGQSRVVSFDSLYINKGGTYDTQIIEFGPGTHTVDATKLKLPQVGWLTIKGITGSRDDVILRVEGEVPRDGNLKLQDLTVTAANRRSILKTAGGHREIWIDNVHAHGPESSAARSSNAVFYLMFRGCLHSTDSLVRKVENVAYGCNKVWRNSEVGDYFGDAIRNPRLVINTLIRDQSRKNLNGETEHDVHPDVFEIQPKNQATDMILYNNVVRDVGVQSMFGGNIVGGAIVDHVHDAGAKPIHLSNRMHNVLFKNFDSKKGGSSLRTHKASLDVDTVVFDNAHFKFWSSAQNAWVDGCIDTEGFNIYDTGTFSAFGFEHNLRDGFTIRNGGTCANTN